MLTDIAEGRIKIFVEYLSRESPLQWLPTEPLWIKRIFFFGLKQFWIKLI